MTLPASFTVSDLSAGEPVPVIAPNDGRVFANWRPDGAPEAEAMLPRLAAGHLSLARNHEMRKQLLKGCIEGLLDVRKELTALMVLEVGKKPTEADAEIEYAIAFLSHCRDLLDGGPLEQRLEDGRTVTDVSLGGALLICPFNDPVAGLTRKMAPAIAAGCPAIVKPSSLSMLCAKKMFSAFRRRGVGQELQLLATGNPGVVKRILEHDDIDIISFTGSTGTGRKLAEACARLGKKSVMELGGNCPFVVFADANQDLAIGDLMERKLKAAGQACSSVNRVFVEASVYKRFVEELLARVDALEAGPSDSGADLGPVRTRKRVNALVDCVARAKADGEILLTREPCKIGGDCPFVFPLTVVEGGENSIFDRHETFGPLLSIRPFASVGELFARLAQERHALAAYFYTGVPETLLPRLHGLRFGSIGINSTAIQGAHAPTGGFRDAGFGREGGVWGVREFSATVNRKMG